MRDKDLAVRNPVLFLDDLPQAPKCARDETLEDSPGYNNIKKWRLQTLLAINPYGIPLLGFAAAYKDMFGRELDVQGMGFGHLSEMVSQMTDVFTVQEPDELTELLFPEYPSDKILHDARFGYDFEKMQIGLTLDKLEPEILINYAWFNRDDDFPSDVVLPGENYLDHILPMTEASVPDSRGVYKALIVSVTNPNHFYVNIKCQHLEQVTKLSAEIRRYFNDCLEPIQRYRVPDEFLNQGFACLVYIREQRSWERCSIIGRLRGKVMVETVDFGGTHLVDQLSLYLMPRIFFNIPKQGVLLSLPGLKCPNGQDKWSKSAGKRMRCFSNLDYFLDVLLLEPNCSKSTENLVAESNGTNSGIDFEKKRMRNKFDKVDFEAIVCDRNDEDLDIFLDEIMLMETIVQADYRRYKEEVEPFRLDFKKVLVNVPRPINPLEQTPVVPLI